MKGQITIEYLISFIIFIGLIAYTYLSYSANIPRFTEEVRKETIRSEAYQLSESIINNPGEPENWDYYATCDINKDNILDNSDLDILKECFYDARKSENWCSPFPDCNKPICASLPSGSGQPFDCEGTGCNPGCVNNICCPQCNIVDEGLSKDVVDIIDITSFTIGFIGQIKRIGLSNQRINKTNFISKTKIDQLNNQDYGFNCSQLNKYKSFMQKVGANRDFSLMIFEINLTNGNRKQLYACNPPGFFSSMNITIQRIAAYNDLGKIKPVEVIIQM